MSENTNKMMNVEDAKMVGVTGLILGLGIWLFPRFTATVGAATIIGTMISDAAAKSAVEKAAENN